MKMEHYMQSSITRMELEISNISLAQKSPLITEGA